MNTANLKFLAKKILREPLFYLLPLLAALYFIVNSVETKISDIKITRNNKTEDIKLPYSADMFKNEVFLISFNLETKNNEPIELNIIPDDCLKEILVNEKNVPLDGIRGLCDYSNGAHIDFSNYIQDGLNHFELRIVNAGGPGGLQIGKSYNGFKDLSIMNYIFAFVFLISFALILRKFKFKVIAIAIILLGVIIRLTVYTYSGPMQSPYDLVAHLEYIQIIAEEKRLPKNDECWECFQPPLYYIAAAAIKNIIDKYDSSLTSRILQQWQLLFSFASVVFGVALILNLLGNSRFAYLASLVLVLWPGFVLAAPRISNDIPFYFGALFCMLFAQRFWLFHKSSDILLASVGASIAFAAKSTGFIILGAWVIVYILKAMFSLKIGSLKMLIASIFIITFFIAFSNYRTVVDIYEGKKVEAVRNINSLNGGLKVQNTMGNYLYIDVKDYLFEPYINPFEDNGGRQYFWSYAIKTSLFGEFRLWNSDIGRILATSLNTLALIIFALALWGIIHAKLKEFPPMLFTVFLFAALVSYRVIYPYSCNNDFRFIFPALFPMAYFSMRGVQILQDSRLRILSYGGMLLFAMLSFAYVVGMAL